MLLSTIHRYPILRGLAAFMLGIYLHNYISDTIAICASVFIVLSLIAAFVFLNRPSFRAQPVVCCTLLVAFFFAGALYTNVRKCEFIDSYKGTCEIHGYVKKIVKKSNGTVRTEIAADTLLFDNQLYTSIDGMAVFADSLYEPRPGDVVHAKAYLKPPTKMLYASFDYSNYLENSGLQFIAEINEVSVEKERRMNLNTIIGSVQASVDERLSACGIASRNMQLLKALFLGDKSELSNDTRSNFSTCGTVHILAVSGMHVGIIYLFLSYVFGAIFRGRKIAIIVTLLGVWCYALIAGMSPSIFRAAVMTTSYDLSRLAGRKSDAYSTIAVAMMIILLADPMSLYTIGLWLSFAAVTGIIALYRPLKMFFPTTNIFKRFIVDSAIVTCSAQLATLPIILYVFHTFPTYFVINNLVIVPMASPIIIGALITLTMSTLSVWLASVFGGLVDGLLGFIQDYAAWAASWPNALITDISFTAIEAITLGVAIICFANWISWGGRHRMRLLIYSAATFCATTIAIDIISLNSSEIRIYETYGKINISVRNGATATHLLADTSSTAPYSAASTINQAERAAAACYMPLRDGTKIITPFDTIVVVATRETDKATHGTVKIICTDFAPQNATKGSNAYTILGTNISAPNIWKRERCDADVAILQSGAKTNGIIIDHGEKKYVYLQDNFY
ncbi:MAG: ComEC/Rec2 family competence protein [Bacteroidales bacterium]|nr:ComEC/Rec2 family competence protein [Bacteroidales bacterium]